MAETAKRSTDGAAVAKEPSTNSGLNVHPSEAPVTPTRQRPTVHEISKGFANPDFTRQNTSR